MASSSAQPPVGPDVPKEAEKSWSNARAGRFEWVSPSPSSMVVAELERLFPDIIQVPVQSLEEEIGRWKNQAILARSLARWIPPEVLVHEFRRAGVLGEIEAVALAHQHYMFQFADAHATELILGRPWVVNGQPIAVSQWQSEFIPSESSLLQALLRVRLPLLPTKFWSDDILSSILSVAEEFQFSDDSTKNRKWSGFARVCVCIDLSKPLRPGARIKGSGSPFWQPFVYEHLNKICSACGSLHFSGDCGLVSDSSSPSSGLRFWLWMGALRRRKPPSV